jgi:anti-sigma factor RsiW
MMTTERPIGEDELHAYVDGFLSPDRQLVVERYLADHPEAAARIAGWQVVGEALRNAAAWKFHEPVPASLNITRLAEARIANRWGPWRMAAGIAIALALGVGSGWLARGPSEPSGPVSAGRETAALNRVSG